MRSSLARSAPSVGAVLLVALASHACGYVPDDLAPGTPPDFQRRGPAAMDGSVLVVRNPDCDPSRPPQSDASVSDAQTSDFPDAFIADDSGPGCAFVECNPGFVCCALDARCYEVSCFDCCDFTPDTGVPSPRFPF